MKFNLNFQIEIKLPVTPRKDPTDVTIEYDKYSPKLEKLEGMIAKSNVSLLVKFWKWSIFLIFF